MKANFESKLQTLLQYDHAYTIGEPLIPDDVYDALRRELYAIDSAHPYFVTVGAAERGGKIPLPHKMGSLDQLYDDNDITNWLSRNPTDNALEVLKGVKGDIGVASHKLDGVSCLLRYEFGKLQQAFTRGDGTNGADITRHMEYINVPQFIKVTNNTFVRGEIIMKDETFKTKYSTKYKRALGLVAGQMNKKVAVINMLNDIDIIIYEIVDIDGIDMPNKHDSLKVLERWGFTPVIHELIDFNTWNFSAYATLLNEFVSTSEYTLDGLVVSRNGKTKDRKSSSLNPTHSAKIKVLDSANIVVATVVDVLWEISKSGFIKPRVEIEPVELFGTTVRYATGFNGNFILSNNIGVGTTINITKSGSVIPYILEVVKGTTPKLPDMDYTWNETNVEMVVSLDNEIVIFKQCLDFFNSLNVDLLKEASLEKMFDIQKLWGKSFSHATQYLFDLLEMEWTQCLGVNGEKIYNSLHRRLKNMTPEIILGSLPFIGFGFGVRKATQLLKQVEFDNLSSMSIDDFIALEGFDIKTAEKLVNNIDKVYDFIKESDVIIIIEKVTTSEFSDLVVVMTGFRDNDLKNIIEEKGGRVTSSVSKKTTHLLTNDINSSTSKIKKAKSFDTAIMLPETFKDEYNI